MGGHWIDNNGLDLNALRKMAQLLAGGAGADRFDYNAVNVDGVGTDFVDVVRLQGIAGGATLVDELVAQGNLLLQ